MHKVRDLPDGSAVYYKGCSVGPTTGVLENVLGYLMDEGFGFVPNRMLPVDCWFKRLEFDSVIGLRPPEPSIEWPRPRWLVC